MKAIKLVGDGYPDVVERPKAGPDMPSSSLSQFGSAMCGDAEKSCSTKATPAKFPSQQTVDGSIAGTTGDDDGLTRICSVLGPSGSLEFLPAAQTKSVEIMRWIANLLKRGK